MERCRWRDKLHVQDHQKYVVVNVPAFHLWAVGPDSVVDMRAACGALKTKTPLLSSQISYMQVNPEWVIPMSIIRDDVARHGGDSNYFVRHRYYIADRRTGQRLSPSAVSPAMLRSGNYRVAQEGGAGNSLGRIIFRFQNNFSVFLHDTSSPGVFQRDNRGVSHGCVRVQRPFDLALFMMEKDPDEWLLDKLRISMGMKPETEQGREYLDQMDPSVKTPQLVKTINVSPRVPILITYYTIFQTPDGSLQHYSDVYGYDDAISESLKPYIE
jgi:murein L,D-transpeptidase YcbB/YkuD